MGRAYTPSYIYPRIQELICRSIVLGQISIHFKYPAVYWILRLKFYIQQQKFLKTNRQMHDFLNTYRRLDGHTDIRAEFNCIVIENFVTKSIINTA